VAVHSCVLRQSGSLGCCCALVCPVSGCLRWLGLRERRRFGFRNDSARRDDRLDRLGIRKIKNILIFLFFSFKMVEAVGFVIGTELCPFFSPTLLAVVRFAVAVALFLMIASCTCVLCCRFYSLSHDRLMQMCVLLLLLCSRRHAASHDRLLQVCVALSLLLCFS
jgi:hypothetical protein